MANIVTQFSDVLSGVVEQLAPSVVRVEGRGGPGSSGVVYSAEHIVTSSHALESEDAVEIGFHDGSTATAELVGRDPATDLAVLEVQGRNLLVAGWAPLDGLKVGHLVLAVSRPGRSARAALGIVSAFGPEWRTPAGGKVDAYVQVDIGLQPGLSGGALVSPEGAVLGITTAGVLRRHAIALPTATVKRVADNLIQHGTVRRGFLGVGVYPVRLPEQIEKQVGQRSGALVLNVQPGGAADQAGLSQGDVLLSLDGTAVGHPGDLVSFLDEDKVGKAVAVKLARGGQILELSLTVGTRG